MWSKVTLVSMKKMQDKSKIYNIHDKAPTPPSNQAIWMANIKFWTQEGSNQTMRFLNAKEHTPPKTKVNHKLPLKPRQIESSVKLNKRRRLPLK
jgi:hypothetical protein